MPDSSSRTILVLLLSIALVGSAAVVGVGFGQETDDGNETAADNQTDASEEESALMTQSTSYLRVAHAAPGAGAVDVYVDNESAATNVPFGAVSGYLALESGTHTVTVTVVGVRDAVVFNESVDLEPGSVTTVAASLDAEGDNGAVVPVAYADDATTPADDESALRIVHLSPNAPAVDIVAVSDEADDETDEADNETDEGLDNETETEAGADNETGADAANETGADTANETGADAANDTAGGAADEAAADQETASETVLAEDVSYTDATDYLTLPAGDYTVEVRTADENATVVATVDVSLESGTAYTAWALGNVPENGSEMPPTFRVLATADATKTIEFPESEPGTPGAPATETPDENVTETPGENVTETTTEETNETETEGEAETTTEEATETETETEAAT